MNDSMIIEYCVTCGDKTPFNWFTDITERMWYVEGAGQLCGKCWNGIYTDKEKIKK